MIARSLAFAALLAAPTSAFAQDAGVKDLCDYQSRAQGVPFRKCVSDNTAAETAMLVMRDRFPGLSSKIDACVDRSTAGVAVNWRDVSKCVAD